MIRFQDSVAVEQAPERVFDFVSDLTNIPKIQAEVVQSTVITPGPVQVGTRFDEIVRVGPWKVPTRCVVTEYDPRGVLAFRAQSRPIDYEGRFSVEPAETGCTVTASGTARLKGLWRLMEPILAGEVRKGIRHELTAIKRHTEMGG
jgi:hypothetical protein